MTRNKKIGLRFTSWRRGFEEILLWSEKQKPLCYIRFTFLVIQLA